MTDKKSSFTNSFTASKWPVNWWPSEFKLHGEAQLLGSIYESLHQHHPNNDPLARSKKPNYILAAYPERPKISLVAEALVPSASWAAPAFPLFSSGLVALAWAPGSPSAEGGRCRLFCCVASRRLLLLSALIIHSTRIVSPFHSRLFMQLMSPTRRCQKSDDHQPLLRISYSRSIARFPQKTRL